MKKNITYIALSVLLLSGCYEDYVKDYDHDAVYVAYQYDLRSVVVGEEFGFNIGAVLGGVLENKRDRKVYFCFDDALVYEDLSEYGASGSFTAIDGMLGKATSGRLSQGYVTTAVKQAGITELTPLPARMFSTTADSRIVIGKGRNTGTVRVQIDSAMFLSNKKAGALPYYAIGYRLTSADADTILPQYSYGVIAIRCENMLFGSWYHGGRCWKTDLGGNRIAGSESTYFTTIPGDEASSAIYKLKTTSPYSVSTSYFHNSTGSFTIEMKEGKVSVSDRDGKITDEGCSWNKAKLLQNRKVFLNYSYSNGDGTRTVVSDTLSFRNRERDGINEWQDENPDHYEK